MVHAKLMQVDGSQTFLGSANMNKASTEVHGELNLKVDSSDSKFTHQVRASIVRDIGLSTKVTSEGDIVDVVDPLRAKLFSSIEGVSK